MNSLIFQSSSNIVHDFWDNCFRKPELLLTTIRLILVEYINRYIKIPRSLAA